MRVRKVLSLAKVTRAVLKTGRRYRAPRVEVALEVEGRSVVDRTERLVELEKHFAVPEHGRDATVHDLLVEPLSVPGDVVQLCIVPICSRWPSWLKGSKL